MARIFVVSAMIALAVSGVSAQDSVHPSRDFNDNWKLGPQAYSFNRFTFFDAVDKAASLGMSWMEAYPGQRLSADIPGASLDHNMSAELRKKVKQKLAENGIKLYCYGVVGLPNNEKEARKVFDFCKDMGIVNIASEPSEDSFDLIDRLAQEYKIYVAIHNHPEPNHYWNPDTVLKVCKGRSKYIGACADTGHWTRSGIDPLEAVKKLKDRIVYFHLKDLNKFGDKGAHDVPWGTGVSKPRQILEYLNEIGWKGYFTIEYEYNWDNSVPEIRDCVHWFEKVSAEINPSGWHRLFKDDLSNAINPQKNWEIKDDVMARVKKGGDIWSKDLYGNFILDLEFKVDKSTNSGVFIRTADIVQWLHTGIEIQVHDSHGAPVGKHMCGAVYDCLEPTSNPVKPAGHWNHMTIIAKDNIVKVAINGQQIIDMDLDKWTDAHKNPHDGSKNKFNTAYKNMARIGHFGFQEHGHPVWYRNIKVKKI